MSKFKIGDKVKVTLEQNTLYGTVHGTIDNYIKVVYDKQFNSCKDGLWLESSLELMEDYKKPQKQEDTSKYHPNAGLLQLIAEGKELQFSLDNIIWNFVEVKTALSLIIEGTASNYEWRVKPETIKIGKYDVTKPLSEAPAFGTKYWTTKSHNVHALSWDSNNTFCFSDLSNGLVWLNKEDAELASKAIKELLTGKPV